MRIAGLGEADVVAELAELLSLCAQLRAEERPGDGAAWAATVALLGVGDGRLEEARAVLREEGDPLPARSVAAAVAGEGPATHALALHRKRVD